MPSIRTAAASAAARFERCADSTSDTWRCCLAGGRRTVISQLPVVCSVVPVVSPALSVVVLICCCRVGCHRGGPGRKSRGKAAQAGRQAGCMPTTLHPEQQRSLQAAAQVGKQARGAPQASDPTPRPSTLAGWLHTCRCRLAACRGALLPAEQPTWCLPGRKSLPHFGQNCSSVPWPRSFPEPRTSGGARKCTLSRHSSAKERLHPAAAQAACSDRCEPTSGWDHDAPG